MDPQVKSILTSVTLAIATAIATWAVSHGFVNAADQSSFINIIVTGIGTLAAAGIVWWKQQSHTPTAQIAAVNNADNGVKVVADNVPSPTLNAPLKNPSSKGS